MCLTCVLFLWFLYFYNNNFSTNIFGEHEHSKLQNEIRHIWLYEWPKILAWMCLVNISFLLDKLVDHNSPDFLPASCITITFPVQAHHSLIQWLWLMRNAITKVRRNSCFTDILEALLSGDWLVTFYLPNPMSAMHQIYPLVATCMPKSLNWKLKSSVTCTTL